jgi:hypothetical protein
MKIQKSPVAKMPEYTLAPNTKFNSKIIQSVVEIAVVVYEKLGNDYATVFSATNTLTQLTAALQYSDNKMVFVYLLQNMVLVLIPISLWVYAYSMLSPEEVEEKIEEGV